MSDCGRGNPMKKYTSTIIMILCFIIGLSALLYPTVSSYINEKNASHVIADYHAAYESTSKQDRLRMIEAANSYNRELASTEDAFIFPDRVEGYDDLLDITGTGIMGYISIDRIKAELPIYHGVDDSVLQIGVGHLEGTSLPVGGKGTHSVLLGHRGLPSAKLFTDLDEVEIGDVFRISIFDQTMTYQVDQIKVVEPTESDDLQVVPDEDYCTLVTCTPYGINTHRILVRGFRVSTEYEKPGIYVENEAFHIDEFIVMQVLLIPFLILTVVILICMAVNTYRIRRKKEQKPKQK